MNPAVSPDNGFDAFDAILHGWSDDALRSLIAVDGLSREDRRAIKRFKSRSWYAVAANRARLVLSERAS